MRRVSPQAVAAVVFVSGMFLSALDITVVNVAIPTLIREFHRDHSAIQWVVTSYLLSLAIWIPATGWFGDRFGTKRIYLLAVAIFTLGSALCGVASSLGQLIAFRALQGVGGGMMVPVGMAMLYRAFPPDRRARVAQLITAPMLIGPALGPIVGGFFVSEVSWRWVFFLNVPLGIATLIFGMLMLDEHREPTAGRIDLPGFVLSGAGLALVLYAMSQGPSQGWGSAVMLGTGLTGVVALATVVRLSFSRPFPLLQLRLLGNRLFRRVNVVCVFAFAGFQGLLFVMPAFLQEQHGLTALQSGFTTFPQAIGSALSAQLVGRLYPRIGPRRLMMGGLAAMGIIVLCFTTFDAHTNLWAIRGLLFVNGMTMSFMVVPMTASMFTTITPSETGQASAIYSTQRQVSAAVGVSVLATVLSSAGGATPDVHAYHVVFLVAAGIAFCGAAMATRVPDGDAAPSMVRRPKVSRPVQAPAH